MKRAILDAVIYTIFGILFTVALLAVMTLCLAMPDILEWLSGYIGGFITYTLFFLSMALLFAHCMKSK